jgi:hypothetical protein
MRDRKAIDSELRLLARGRRSIREQGGQPSYGQADKLLDEWLAHSAGATETEAVEGREITRSARKGARSRFRPLTALPLSLVALAAVVVVMFAVHRPHPAEEPTAAPPPSSAPPTPAAPKPQAPLSGIVDSAFVDALKQQGVPIPSHEYATNQGHAVCDFLTHQRDFAEAVRFVQRSSIWDADQSTAVTAGAVVSFCPQYEPASPDLQPAFQKTLSDLQAIEGHLQGIEGDLQGIQDGLQGLPGHG